MITTFNTMPPPVLHRTRFRLPIIAALLATLFLVSACGMALQLGYDQGSPIAFRWLDDYVDFDDAQSLRVRSALDEWFAWHRRTQLPDYADLLARAEVEVLSDTTADRTCAWAGEIRRRVEAGFEHARPTLVELLPTLKPQQIANVEKKYAARNETYRDDHLQRDPVKRRDAAAEREVERAEKLYGARDDAQRDKVARWIAASPYEAEVAYAERLRRQQDALALMRRLITPGTTRAEVEAQVGAYVQRLDRSPNEDYRRYAIKLGDDQCAFAAALHNSTSSAQRGEARKRLHGYEGDLRALAADTPR
jgi:hypothetical protein